MFVSLNYSSGGIFSEFFLLEEFEDKLLGIVVLACYWCVKSKKVKATMILP